MIENLKLVTHDTRRQIEYCLKCNSEDCTNCLRKSKIGSLPTEDPCFRCHSKRFCRSGSCAARTRYDLLVRQNPSILDEGPISADCVKRHLKKGQFVVIAAPGGPRKSKVLWINKTSFRTEDDLYYFYEHRKLWWFTERGAAIEKQI